MMRNRGRPFLQFSSWLDARVDHMQPTGCLSAQSSSIFRSYLNLPYVNTQDSASDMRPVEANLKYVGILRKITQVDYGVAKFNVLSCSWIKPNVAGNRTMRKDEHGFWLVKNNAFKEPLRTLTFSPLKHHTYFMASLIFVQLFRG
ncbi:hypothetical protein M758_UG012500 [Ceratodon purpureus]|nr:hypothetical protein M758_UG012500 [Ceratodon purpureus]